MTASAGLGIEHRERWVLVAVALTGGDEHHKETSVLL